MKNKPESEGKIHIKFQNEPESENSVHIKVENKPACDDSVQVNKMRKSEQKKTTEAFTRQGGSMLSIFGKKERDGKQYPYVKRPFPRTKSNLLEKTKQSLSKLTNQHFQKNSEYKPHFSFLQTLV